MYFLPGIFVASVIVLLYALNHERHPSAYITDTRTNVSYQGVSINSVDSFQNIHYGQDTSGSGRFAPPKPFIPAHNTIINATVAGAACPQQLDPFPGLTGLLDNVTNISEDCLTLRIARPAAVSQNAKLPVMVFIYGGGYTLGQAYDHIYDPNQLVLDSVESGSPVIYAAMNYRLGIFGFASSDLLKERKSANAGLRDQRLALEWIKENIQVFGGDLERVTVFGESAGGSSIALQLSAFGGQRRLPFQQAILESGSVVPLVATKLDANDFAAAVSVSGCNYLNSNSQASLDCLRSLTWEELLEVQTTVDATKAPLVDGLAAFIPVVDGDFIPAEPSTLYRTGRFSRIPIMIGWNHDDGSLFTAPTVKTESDSRASLQKSFPAMTASTLDRLLGLYPAWDFEPVPALNITSEFLRASRIFRDVEFTCGALFVADIVGNPRPELHQTSIYHAESSPSSNILQKVIGSHEIQHHHQLSPPIFVYELNQSSLTQFFIAQGFTQLEISHIADIPYVFDEVSKFNDSASNMLLAKQMTGSWTRFATSGVPSSPKGTTLKGWTPAFEGKSTGLDDLQLYVIGGGSPEMTGLHGGNVEIAKERLLERCTFINSEKVQKELGT